MSGTGREDLAGIDDVVDAVLGLRAERPGAGHAIVKLNEGVSGEGNATVDLRGLPAPGSDREPGAVEERIAGEEFRSPSVQMRVTPLGSLEVLSTHVP